MSAVSHGAMVSHRLANPCKLLRDERGASIIIALVFLLICAMVSAVALNFASANVERTKQNSTDAQAYEAVASASRFATTGIFKAEGISGVTMTVADRGAAPTWNSSSLTGTVGKWLKAQAENIYYGRETTPLENVSIIAENPYNDEALPTVKATYSMDKETYFIYIEVRIDDSSNETGESVAYSYTVKTEIIAAGGGSTPPFTVSWAMNAAPSYLAGADSLWQQNKDSWSGLSGDKQTQSLQALYFSQYAYELSEYEKGLSGAYSEGSYGWKPLVASDGSVILAACTNPTSAGAAKNSILLYVNGTYYKWADKWGDKTAWVNDNKFDLSTLGVLGTNDAGWRKVS